MDEVGSRVHIDNINVPKAIVDLEKEIETQQELKSQHIKKQEFEKAAESRDKLRNGLMDR